MTRALIIAAPHSASGKTTITLGLIRALNNSGLRTVSMKIGPDYIDPGFHAQASGAPCLNLDLWAMGAKACRSLLATQAAKADIVIIEGVMGLFDGPQGQKGSTADLAEAMDLPVLLVVDCAHQAQSVAALYHGFAKLRPNLQVAGLILNRVKSDRHEAMLRELLPPAAFLGSVRQIDSLRLPSRHLGLVQLQEIQHIESIIEDAAATVARETVLDKIASIARPIANQPCEWPLAHPLGSRIAIARDKAFSFAYPHLLDSWHEAGAELSFFSPLGNETPSTAADAIFLPGGYPELHAAQLASNTTCLDSLRQSKALIYGECGGYMVLGDALIDAKGSPHRMAGLLPVTTSFAGPKLHLGYRQLQPLAGPWKSPLRGHEFHYSSIASQGNAAPLFRASDAAGSDLGAIGMVVNNVMGSYAHIISEAP